MEPGEALYHFKSDDIVDKTMVWINPNQPGLFWHLIALGNKMAPVISPGYETLRMNAVLHQIFQKVPK